MNAKTFLKEKGINPIEPIYWNLEDKQIFLEELMEEFANQLSESGLVGVRCRSDDPSTAEGEKYAFSNIEEYEEISGFKTNEAFRIGWDMARTKNKHLISFIENSRAI